MVQKYIYFILTFCFSFCLLGCDKASIPLHSHNNIVNQLTTGDTDGDSPVKLVGERLFRETRFSQYYFQILSAQPLANSNTLPPRGDAVVETLESLQGSLQHPYKGQSISCASCHFVDQAQSLTGAGQRAYTDFARRSPIPDLQDGRSHTARNSPVMVGSSTQDAYFLHHDGEFGSAEDLVRASITGRNLGWSPAQQNQAKAHIVNIVRKDDGSFPTETTLKGLSYKRLFANEGSIPRHLQLPLEYQLNIAKATDDQVFEYVVKLIGGYLRILDFKKDKQGHYKGSPFDTFLAKNGLPQAPESESAENYMKRLGELLKQNNPWNWVSNSDRTFTLHQQTFTFSEKELAGFRIFVGKGKCISCHAAPDFTDHLFHNTGVSQDEYDTVHGAGGFTRLSLPDLSSSEAKLDDLRRAPEVDSPDRADLGVWAVYAKPSSQSLKNRLRHAICAGVKKDCSQLTEDQIQQLSLAMIKTPTLRDLGHSQPYFHTGQVDDLEGTIRFYIKISLLARMGKIRNADPMISQIDLKAEDIEPLVAFLKSLNEDYN
jgi:cytochrome c peroxidase